MQATHLVEKIHVNTPEEFQKMPDEYRELLIHQLKVHTEGEISGADDYIELLYPMAPNAYEKKICCERAAEEVDHYMKGAEVLKDIGVDVEYMVEQSLEDRNLYGTEAVKQINTWAERGLFSFLGEAAVLEQLAEMHEVCSYQPMKDMFPSVIKDEHVHVAHGFRVIREMCKTQEGKAEVQETLLRWWPITLDLFGRSDSRRSKLYVKWGLRKYSNEDARNLYIEKTIPKLTALGLVVPDNVHGRKYL